MRRTLAALNARLSRPAAGGWLLGLAVGLYAVACWRHDLFPGFGPGAATRGWWTWSDQQRYLAEAAAIAEGRLDRSSYTYPIGYPVLGALAWRWLPAHAFLLPNLLLFAGSAAAWWRLARRWFEPLAALAVAAVFVLFHRWLVADTQVVPWNTLPTQCALLVAVVRVTNATAPRPIWPLALLAGAAYAVRPVDAVAFAPLLAWAAWEQHGWRPRLRAAATAAAIVALFMAAVGLVNLRVFGSWRTAYDVASVNVGFGSYPFAYKSFWLFVDGRPLFGETTPALLFRYPWLLLVPAAGVFWIRRDGWRALAALAAVGCSWIVYLSYNDFLPSDVYRFTLIHYLAWSFPLLFLVVAAVLRHGWPVRPVRWAFAGSGLLFVLCAGLRMDERPLAPTQPAADGWPLPSARPLLIRFPGAPAAAVSRLRVDGAAPREYAEYLSPYVESDLRILLSARRPGRWLTIAPGSEPLPAPVFAEYVWRWRPNPGRIKRLCQ
jgi:hypothetical protein